MCVYIYIFFCGGDHKNIEREILLCMYIYIYTMGCRVCLRFQASFLGPNIRALTTRIGFGGVYSTTVIVRIPKSNTGHYVGRYIRAHGS